MSIYKSIKKTDIYRYLHWHGMEVLPHTDHDACGLERLNSDR